jgi:hypothetical protein
LKMSSFERVIVKNWVEFWRWQSKVTNEKWQERNYVRGAKKTSCVISNGSETYKSVARLRLVKTENPSACVNEL